MMKENDLIELLKSALLKSRFAFEAESVDWNRLFRLAKSHGIANTLYYAVKDFPDNISEPFRLEWLRSVQIDTIQRLETDDILKQLNARQIRCMPLKGYNLKNIYPSPEMRSMGDTDILIDAENMPRITEIMLELGFTPDPNQGGGNHYSFTKRPIAHVEFHHSLFDVSSPLSECFNPGWQYARAFRLADRPINRPTDHTPACQPSDLPACQPTQLSAEGAYIYMLAHMAKHFMAGGTGIRSVMDVWVYNRRYGQSLDWAFIDSEFERAGLMQFAQNIRDLSEVWFDTKEPTELLDELGDYIIASGTYGTVDHAALNQVLKSDGGTAWGFRKVRAFAKRVFFPLKEMRFQYPFLIKLPFLLPVGWMLRGFRVLKNRKDFLKSWINIVFNVNEEELEQYIQKLSRFGLANIGG